MVSVHPRPSTRRLYRAPRADSLRGLFGSLRAQYARRAREGPALRPKLDDKTCRTPSEAVPWLAQTLRLPEVDNAIKLTAGELASPYASPPGFVYP